jgi:hypothetical protein
MLNCRSRLGTNSPIYYNKQHKNNYRNVEKTSEKQLFKRPLYTPYYSNRRGSHQMAKLLQSRPAKED